MKRQKPELRRHPRVQVNWPAILSAGTRVLQVELQNLAPLGAKVSLDDQLQEGTAVSLHLQPPHGGPIEVQAIVWRTDEDGSAFFFIGASPRDSRSSEEPRA